ncbi:IucA/IucC family C-terminal-domain containing protein [Paenibacillus pasadenensis]|nr:MULTISPECIES: IucA/IucC family C-terminal-domain containing protein [Paenibacillus]
MGFDYERHEIDLLTEEFRLALEPSEDRRLSMPALDLLDRDKCLGYIGRAGEVFEGQTIAANASLFAKRYSYLTIASSLYAMSAMDKGLDYSIENAHIESVWRGSAWLPRIRLEKWEANRPEAGKREAWRERIVASVFADNISRAWNAISAYVPVSKAVLWENAAIYVFWLYENRFLEGLDEERQAIVRSDLAYLVEAPPHLFGEKKNPLGRYYGPKVATVASEEPIRIRKTCCFYYLASDDPEDYCPTCPKINHQPSGVM